MEKTTEIMDRQSIAVDIYNLLTKSMVGLILLGLLGRFSYDLLRNKKFTIGYILGCTGASLVVGYMGGTWVTMHYPENATILTVISTMLANNLVSAIMSIDYRALLQKNWKEAFDVLTRKKD